MSVVQQHIDDAPMTGYQIAVIGLCTFLNMLDGFDILVMAFAAPSVAAEWGLSNSQVGVLLSAGLFGMAVGAFTLGPLADSVGRKPTTILSLALISVGMTGSYWAQHEFALGALRFVTGVGVGGMIASLNTLVSEFSPKKHRSLMVTILQVGNPIGATLGGLLSVYIITNYGWRPTFLIGGVISLALIPVLVVFLPESVDYLSARPRPNSLSRINAILRKLNIQPVTTAPDREDGTARSFALSYAGLFNSRNRGISIQIATCFFLVMFSFYYTMSWTPKLLVEAGYATSAAISGSVVLNIGGAIGAILLGIFSRSLGLQKGIGYYMVGTFLFMTLFGVTSGNLGLAFTIALFLGAFLFGSIIGLYALAPELYGVEQRAAGIGMAIGFGRFGAVVAPLLAGVILDKGMDPSHMYLLFGLPMLVAFAVQRSIAIREGGR